MSALRRCPRITTVAAAAAAATAITAAVVPADARTPGNGKGRSIYHSPLLWATVNVCDTPDHPNTVGIRASMPGSGFSRERMYVRFQVQYFSAGDEAWHNLGPAGDSGWVRLGSGRYRARQAGRNFVLKAPAEGMVHRVRGAVTFEWRRGKKVVRRARKRTTAGHGRTRGADPAGYSAAVCEIR